MATSLSTDLKIMAWKPNPSITSLRLEKQSLRQRLQAIKVITPLTINLYLPRLASKKISCLLKIDLRKPINIGRVVYTMKVMLQVMTGRKHRCLSMKSLILNMLKETAQSRSIALALL
jgi:hypothetical protein